MQSTYPPPPPYFPLYKHGATIPEGLTRKTVPEGYVITPPAPPPVPTGEYRVFGYTENVGCGSCFVSVFKGSFCSPAPTAALILLLRFVKDWEIKRKHLNKIYLFKAEVKP